MKRISLTLVLVLMATCALAQNTVNMPSATPSAENRFGGKLWIGLGVQPKGYKRCDRQDADGQCWVQCGRLAFIGDLTAETGSGEVRWKSPCGPIKRLFKQPEPTPRPTPFPIGQTACERGEKGWCMVWSPTTGDAVCIRCNL